MSSYDIKYIPHNEIDKRKWDHCMDHADHPLIYGYSFYLDFMADNWDALVWEDYSIIMPLPWRRKYMIQYLYQPFLAAQLGLFGKNINPQVVEAFIQAIPGKFKLVEMPLNSSNHPVKHKHIITRNNYVVDLAPPYETLFGKFNDNTRRNIKKAAEAGATTVVGIGVDDLIRMARAQMRSYGEESDKNVALFRKLFEHLHHNNRAVTYGVYSGDDRLLAAAVFFFSHHRTYYILVGNDPESKMTGASHFLVNSFIKDHAGKPIILDFEGSDLPSLAFFYSGFGALNEKYPFLKMNRLPFYLKWLKK